MGCDPTNTRVFAIIVSYNRKDTLRQCLTAVLEQTRVPDEIVVVNNASADGTYDMLEAEFSHVNRIHMVYNVGGAGGFYRGMSWAHDNDADWMWLMDDDGGPAPDCLEHLLEPDVIDKFDVLNPLVVSTDDSHFLSFGHPVARDTVFEVAKVRHFAVDGVIPGAIAPFNGTLIRRQAYEKVGPIKREMFIWGDEIEYGSRLTALSIPHGTVVDALHRHPPQRRLVVRLRPLGIFHLMTAERAGIDYRNFAYYSIKAKGMPYVLAKSLAYCLFFVVSGNYRHIGKFLIYTLDGLTDRYAQSPSRAELFHKGSQFEIMRRA